MKKFSIISMALFLLLFTVACDDSDEHTHEGEHSGKEESITSEACEHMAEGPATAVTAGATESEAANTDVDDWKHKRVDVILTGDANGGFLAYLTYEAAEAAEYVFFTSEEVMLQIDGTDPETVNTVTECSDVQSAHVFDLEVGEHMVFVSATTDSVSFVAEGAVDNHADHAGE